MSDEEFLNLCENENPEEIEDALKNGANVNARYKDGCTALHVAALFSADCAEVLLKYGADVDARDDIGRTALFYAHNMDMADLLLDYGADLNARDNWGMTALEDAIYRKANLMIEYLASKSDKNTLNDVLRHSVVSAKFAYYLVMFGADVNLKDEKGNTALHYACNSEIAEFLLKYGADINARNNEGDTPLTSAYDRGDLDVVKVLISHGVEI